MIRIAVVEDDPVLSDSIVQRLRLEGYDTVAFATGADALAGLGRTVPALVLCDMRLPDIDGETVMRRAFGAVGVIPIIFMTAYGDFRQAVRLVREGARDYIPKPFDLDELVERIDGWTTGSRSEEPAAADDVPFRGRSAAIARVRQLLARAALIDTPVLLTGETGTGKEVAARFLAHAGRGRGRPFVAVNGAALTPELAMSQLFGHERGAFTGAHARATGALEQAKDGTLFLDEVGELSPEVQGQLLRVLEDRRYCRLGGSRPLEFAGRFVFATNRDLPAQIRQGRFREDLYYRIGVIECRLPPLRERRDEIDDLLGAFVAEIAGRLGSSAPSLAPDALREARAHGWPGNVRELRNRVERALALTEGPLLTAADLFPERSPALRQSASAETADAVSGERLADARAAAEAAHIRRILEETGRNIQETARRLGISRTTLWEKMRAYDL